MNSQNKLSVKQFCFIIIICFSITKFYILPAMVSSISNQSGWFVVLLNFLVDFLLLLACLYIIKNQPTNNLFSSSNVLFGKTLTKIVFVIYAVYFFIKSFIPVLEQKNTINLTFYESQPNLLIFMPFFIVCFYILLKGINAFGRSVEIMLFLFVPAILITFSLSAPSGEYAALLPVISFNSNVFKGFYSLIIWFGDPVMLLFLSKYLKTKNNINKKVIISFLISMVITILLIVVFYAIFQGISARQYYATIKMSKYSITLSNIGRLDYMAAVMFACVCVYAVILPLMLSVLNIKTAFNVKNKWVLPLIITGALGILVLIYSNEIFKTISFFQRYLTPAFILISYVLPLIMLIRVAVYKKNHKGAKNV